MLDEPHQPHRRAFLKSAAMALGAGSIPSAPRASIAITLDLEMSRHYPTADKTHWDYDKGNLDEATKRYAVDAARLVKERGGRIHFFAVGRTMEQEDIRWIEEIAADGHPVGNHTYDHINVKATRPDDIQFRFKRAPWLIEGKTTSQVVSDNIALARTALKSRAGIEAAGFRTPGGFYDGLADRPDVQKLLLAQGYRWVSSKYPRHPSGEVGATPSRETFDAIVAAQADAQPFVYPSGLIEVPMSPISDVTAFRATKWKLGPFLEALERSVTWAIENRAVFDFLAHPSCLIVEDPKFRAVELICDLVRKAGDRATLTDLDQIAANVKRT